MKQLIEKDFFPRELDINPRKVYPTFVMSTMSIGKSTLINALVGKDVLPSSNGAWTARRRHVVMQYYTMMRVQVM